AFIVKRELMWLPLFGWYAWKAGMIPVDRGARSQALAAIGARALVELARNRQIIIFPEGTRRRPGAEPAYKFGVVHLYEQSGVPASRKAGDDGVPRSNTLRCLVGSLEPLGEHMQVRFIQPQRLHRGNCREDVIAVGAGLSMALADIVQLLGNRQAPGILGVAA